MPRMPDQQHAWFHHPHHHQPTQRSGHHRSFSYHMPQPQPQQQQQQQQQQTQQLSQPQRQSPPGFNQPADNISPLSTSNSTSPVSPKNYHGRQVRPLYMPAVLRPNEYHSSGGIQAKVPRSPGADDLDDDERGVRSSGSFTSLQGILSLSGLSRRSTGDSGKVVDWNWDLSNYPKVNGQPTRRHWKVRTIAMMRCDALRPGATRTRTSTDTQIRSCPAVNMGIYTRPGTAMSQALKWRHPSPSQPRLNLGHRGLTQNKNKEHTS